MTTTFCRADFNKYTMQYISRLGENKLKANEISKSSEDDDDDDNLFMDYENDETFN